jgi:hypothetical protein
MTRRRRATIDRDPDTGRIYVNSVDEIPVFSSDEEESVFWNSHEPTLDLIPRGHKTAEQIAQMKGLPKR